mmetsp:Transcript_98929/g.262748  ORF Transcript_98929/g.262748 Transcript_98929/m.262748 type:complete len:288 (-) Transcript_98929:76-939(-)
MRSQGHSWRISCALQSGRGGDCSRVPRRAAGTRRVRSPSGMSSPCRRSKQPWCPSCGSSRLVRRSLPSSSSSARWCHWPLNVSTPNRARRTWTWCWGARSGTTLSQAMAVRVGPTRGPGSTSQSKTICLSLTRTRSFRNTCRAYGDWSCLPNTCTQMLTPQSAWADDPVGGSVARRLHEGELQSAGPSGPVRSAGGGVACPARRGDGCRGLESTPHPLPGSLGPRGATCEAPACGSARPRGIRARVLRFTGCTRSRSASSSPVPAVLRGPVIVVHGRASALGPRFTA